MYNKSNLPDTLFTPPIPAPHPKREATWSRNWTLFYLASTWNGPKHGMLTTLSRWLHDLNPAEEQLSRERIRQIIYSMAWATQIYAPSELGLPESKANVS